MEKILKAAVSNVCETDYFHNKGFSSEVINEYKLGFLEEGLEKFSLQLNDDKKFLSCYKFVIPNIDRNGNVDYLMFRSDKNFVQNVLSFEVDSSYATGNFLGKIWNEKIFYGSEQNIFITETWTDALSVIQCGGVAIALNRVTYIVDLWKKLSAPDMPRHNFILACDADYYGRKTNKNLAKMLSSINFSYLYFTEFPEDIKDCNEWLLADSNSFAAEIKKFY